MVAKAPVWRMGGFSKSAGRTSHSSVQKELLDE